MNTQPKWKQIAQLNCDNTQIGQTKFKGHGDWFSTIQQIPKTELTKQEMIQSAAGNYHIEEQNLERYVNPDVKTFSQALNDCGLEFVSNQEIFLQANDIGDLCYYQRLVYDGNTTISVAEDQKYYYYIFFETS